MACGRHRWVLCFSQEAVACLIQDRESNRRKSGPQPPAKKNLPSGALRNQRTLGVSAHSLLPSLRCLTVEESSDPGYHLGHSRWTIGDPELSVVNETIFQDLGVGTETALVPTEHRSQKVTWSLGWHNRLFCVHRQGGRADEQRWRDLSARDKRPFSTSSRF